VGYTETIDLTALDRDAPDMNDTPRGRVNWPALKAAQDLSCDGKNPTTGRNCVLGYHQGYHRDDTNAAWLDDGDADSHPSWPNHT
jgi:hypothetical protein